MSVPAYAEYKDSGVAWLGTVPSHWERKPLFALVRELDDCNTGMQEDNLLSLSYGQIKRKNIEDNDGLLPASFETYQIVERDDIIWRLTDLQNDQRSLRTGMVRERGIITSAYLATRPITIEPEFLAYLLRAYDLTKVFYSMGGGLRQSMKFSDVKWLPVMLPSQAEQTAITTFLDRETAKIDALVAEQERLIALLKEKRQAVISHAVTKGLNPNAPMKDSGIEWLGEIPAHWEVRRIKHVAVGQLSYGANEAADEAVEGNPRFVRITDVASDGTLRPDTFRSLPSEIASPYLLKEGDILLARSGATVGKSFIYKRDWGVCCYAGYLIRLRVATKIYLPSFVYYSLQSTAFWQQIGANQIQSTIQNFSAEKYGDMMFAFPSLDEQVSITRELSPRLSRFDELTSEAEQAITLLQERRAALISAAVTGKIDVRGSVANAVSALLDPAPAEHVLPSLRAVVGGLVVLQLGPMGRMAVMKGGYLAEAHCGLRELGGRYERYAAGPYDSNLIAAMERGAAELCGVQTNEPTEKGDPVTYAVPKAARAPMEDLRSIAGDERAKRLSRLLADLSSIGRDGVEAVATLYAVWNDLLAADRPADDDSIFTGVLTEWHYEKARKFKQADLERWIAWMRRNGVVPDGTAPRTDHQGNLFA